jgi:5-keto 4-deoxyuronate isomerase
LSWAKPEKDLKTSRHLSRSEIIVTECGSKHKITGGKRSFRLNHLQPADFIFIKP